MAKKQDKQPPIAQEPVTSYGRNELNADVIWQLFQETDRQFKETDKKFQDTDRQFKETDRKFQEFQKAQEKSSKEWEEIKKELGGIGKSNGEIAEEYFYSALETSLQVGKMKFDYISRNLHRKKNKTEAEFDIVLYNNHKVLIVEVKHNFRIQYLRSFFKEKLKKFKVLFPEYKNYKVYGAIAAMTFGKEVRPEAEEYGFYILSQRNESLKLLNAADFEPGEVK